MAESEKIHGNNSDLEHLKNLVDKVEEIARIEESIQALEQVIESDQEMPEPTVDCHRFDAVVPPLSEAEAEAMAKELVESPNDVG